MGNNFFTFLILLVFQVSFSQNNITYAENYKFLSKTEYERFIEIKAEKTLNGNYYIVDNRKNISIKKYNKGVKTGEWLSFNNLFNGLKLTSTINYYKGKKHGYFFITDNHTYIEEGYYKCGKKHGVWTKKNYFDTDIIIETKSYKKGKIIKN